MPPSDPELIGFLFSTVARKLPPFPFGKGAAVARYLDNLVYETPAGKDLERLLSLSKVVWGRVFQFARFRAAEKSGVIELLQEFASSHLADWEVGAAVKTVRAAKPPKERPHPRVLLGPTMAITQAKRPARLSDDLTERIYAAYSVLRASGTANARTIVAKALNQHGFRTRSRNSDNQWTGYEVGERLAQYEKLAVKVGKTRGELQRGLIEKWTGQFHLTRYDQTSSQKSAF
ncbi:MAG: hypothetical protein ABIR70_17730 [Bryobacteraceae bacterium]